MKKTDDINNKIYQLMQKNSGIELEAMQKEATAIQKAVDDTNNTINDKKDKMNSIMENIKGVQRHLSLDLTLFQQQRQYLSGLQDELLHDELLSKSLQKRQSMHFNKMKEKYQEGKLYNTMVENNNHKEKDRQMKHSEKLMDELASTRQMEVLIDE